MARQTSNIQGTVVAQGELAANQVVVQQPAQLSVKDRPRSEMLRSLGQIRPAFAADIAAADAVDQARLNAQAEVLVKELAIVNQEWNQTIAAYNDALSEVSSDPLKIERFTAWRETQWAAEADKGRRIVELRSFAPTLATVEERMDDVMKCRHVLSSKLRLIQERKDAPLFARMMCAADLIRWNMHSLAAEVLLDLIEVASNGGDKTAKENSRAEWFLKKIASLHRLKWLDELIEVKPPEVTSYRKLRATMLLASIREPGPEEGNQCESINSLPTF